MGASVLGHRARVSFLHTGQQQLLHHGGLREPVEMGWDFTRLCVTALLSTLMAEHYF